VDALKPGPLSGTESRTGKPPFRLTGPGRRAEGSETMLALTDAQLETVMTAAADLPVGDARHRLQIKHALMVGWGDKRHKGYRHVHSGR
jgi:hypothetical protein